LLAFGTVCSRVRLRNRSWALCCYYEGCNGTSIVSQIASSSGLLQRQGLKYSARGHSIDIDDSNNHSALHLPLEQNSARQIDATDKTCKHQMTNESPSPKQINAVLSHIQQNTLPPHTMPRVPSRFRCCHEIGSALCPNGLGCRCTAAGR
jgi:hypothetical protein